MESSLISNAPILESSSFKIVMGVVTVIVLGVFITLWVSP